MNINLFRPIHLLSIVAICRISSLSVKSATCVEQYAVKFHFVIAYGMRSDVLMCRCDCDKHVAGNYFFAALENYQKECNKIFAESRGFCIETIRDKMNLRGCDNSGYSYCYVKMTANALFNFTTFDIQRTYYNITTTDDEIIQIPVDQNYVLVKGKRYKIYFHGPPCERANNFLRYYQNINAVRDKRYEACKTNNLEDKFLRTNQFFITNNISYHQKLWSRMDYSDEVCRGVYSGFIFNTYDEYDTNCRQILYIPQFRDVNETAAFLSREVDLVLISLSREEPSTETNQSPSSTRGLEDQTQQADLSMVQTHGANTKLPFIESNCNTFVEKAVLIILIMVIVLVAGICAIIIFVLVKKLSSKDSYCGTQMGMSSPAGYTPLPPQSVESTPRSQTSSNDSDCRTHMRTNSPRVHKQSLLEDGDVVRRSTYVQNLESNVTMSQM